MDNSNDIQQKFLKLKDEFETYQNFAESTMQMINEKNTRLERNLDALTNIVEISKYINSNVSDENLIPMINDMIIGILGVTYSSIYLIDDKDKNLIAKATNIENDDFSFENYGIYCMVNNEEPFVVNCKDSIFSSGNKKVNIHSIIGVPIYSRDIFKGYIIVEHTLLNFFSQDHIAFISSITNQIGIALENNFLYSKVKESSITDPLLNIYNRKYFFDYLEEKVIKDPQGRFAIVMIDIDNFKRFNDAYGHQFGDKVLIETTKVLKDNIDDEEDLIARYGGEEIVIYINNVRSYSEVFKKVDNLREELFNHVVEHGNEKKSVTASFGISYYPENGDTVQKVLSVADSMLYVAKNSGRNKVISS
ncbi:sensor domain-containing diguanylate cyclase [Clostridium akagii]|uniref:sensor domain-containing diguanylate cyclase n=1 Tax=Clostridium akagii TaxID=91623 RepID=UPI00047A9B38|nr:sensor domain-containing diguanylate cyclase [Clostridium akagii]